MVAPGQAGKEASTGQNAPQPSLERDIGVPQMWLWCWGYPRALASMGFSPTAVLEQPGVEDGAWREPGCRDSYGLFGGAMFSPTELFVGAMLSLMGLLVGAMLRPTVDPHSQQEKRRCFALTLKIFPKPGREPRHTGTPFPPHVTPWAPQSEEQSTPAPIPAPSARLCCPPRMGATQARREQAPAAPTC